MKTSQTSSIDLIVEYHRLYAQYHRPEYLEIAAILGRSGPDLFQEKWERLVNDGCERRDMPRLYGDNSKTPLLSC
jgi:hypothetical protein